MLFLRRDGCQPISLVLPPRTGSRSIQRALEPLITNKLGSRHSLQCGVSIPQDCLLVSSIRHPLDVLVSWFHFPDSHQPQNGPHRFTMGGRGKTFDNYIDFVLAGGNPYLSHSTLRHADEARDLIRYEDGLERSANDLLRKYGYPEVDMPHVGKTDRPDFRSYYTPGLVSKVVEKYSDDFERFGYSV